MGNRIFKNKTPKFLRDTLVKREQWIAEKIKNGIDLPASKVIFNGVYGFLGEETKSFFKELRLKPEYQQKVDEFTEQHLKGKTVLGVHIRYYDKNLPVNNHTKFWLEPEKSMKIIESRIEKIISEIDDPNFVILLVTDNKMVHDTIRKNFDKVVSYEKKFDIVQKGMHLSLPVDSAFAGLIEMFLLAKSDIMFRFPPHGSWFSHYGAIHAKKVY
ncbi:MAG: nodulation protein NodZ [Bacteroidales bacterium]